MEPHSCGQVSQLPKSSQWQVIFRPWRVDRLTWQVLYVNSTVRFFFVAGAVGPSTVNYHPGWNVRNSYMIFSGRKPDGFVMLGSLKVSRTFVPPGMQMQEKISSSTCSQGERSSVSHYIIETLPKAPKSKHSTRKGFAFFFCWIGTEMAFSGTILVFGACGGACMYGFLLHVWSFQSTGFWQEKCMQDSNFHHTKTHPTFLTPMDPPFQHPKTKPCPLRYGFELAIKSSESDDPRRFNTPPVH